jgi:glycosyltransferase involved in cell wall biosynthesis
MRNKRILYVEGNSDGTIGGSFFSLLFLIKNLDRTRFTPVVVFSTDNALVAQFQAAGAEVVIRPLARPVPWTHWLLRPFGLLANAMLALVVEPLRLAWLMRRRSIDLVHLNNSIERNLPWIRAAVLARIPRITHERGINERVSPQASRLVRHLDGVICISSAVRENLERLGLGTRNLVTIWNGLDPNEMRVRVDRNTVLGEFGLGQNTRMIGMVGNIRQWKGQSVVIEAMRTISRRHSDVVCLLIGHFAESDREYKQSIERMIAENDLGKCVVITGYRSNVADYVATLDVLIHASILPEPFGRVLLEGMALRKPLVASRGGAVPEIVEDGVSGLLFEPGNPQDLAEKLLCLLESRETARSMGEAGYARLIEKFGIDGNANRTMVFYEQVLG